MNRDPHELYNKRMPIVLQPVGSCLCQAACVAMITRLTLRTVLKYVKLHNIQSDTTENGLPYLSDWEAAKFLLSRGWHMGCWPMWSKGILTVPDCEIGLSGLEKHPSILAVQSEFIAGSVHAVVWDKVRRKVLDPHYDKPQSVERYHILEWIPVIPFVWKV